MEKRAGLSLSLVLMGLCLTAQPVPPELDSGVEARAHIETMQQLQDESRAVLKPEQRHFPFDSSTALHSNAADKRLAAAEAYFRNYQDEPENDAPSISLRGFSAVPRGLMLVALAAIAVFVLILIFKSRALGLRQNTTSKSTEALQPIETVSRYDLLQKAISAERSGEFRLAIRYYYNHLLHQLSEAGMVNEGLGKTNYQYLAEIEDKQQRNQLARLMFGFDLAWYGGYDPGPTQFETWKKDFRNFQQAWRLG